MNAWEAVRSEFGAVDRALSRFRDDSELTAFNRQAGTGAVIEVSWRLRMALAAMDRAARITDGRFDASVLEALERIGEHGAPLDAVRNLGWADPRDVPGATGNGHQSDALTERPVRVRVSGAPLDSGGIGKGLALRWAAARAEVALPGVAFLLESGGDLVASGRHPSEGWRVGVEDPVAPDGLDAPPVAVIGLETGAIATSSISVRNWTAPDGRRVHHLVDPRTAAPARTGLIAVTVAGADPAWSEVWSKALFLAGRTAIGNEARSRGLAAWWIDEAGRLGMSPEARVRSVWVAEERLG
jgi:thiamine biosynthesis lipoprotein